jgi:hypothetical protein
MTALQRRFFFSVIIILFVSIVVSAVATLVVTAAVNLLFGVSLNPRENWGIWYIVTVLVWMVWEIIKTFAAHSFILSLQDQLRLSYIDVCDAVLVYRLHKKRPFNQWDAQWVKANLAMHRKRGH